MYVIAGLVRRPLFSRYDLMDDLEGGDLASFRKFVIVDPVPFSELPEKKTGTCID